MSAIGYKSAARAMLALLPALFLLAGWTSRASAYSSYYQWKAAVSGSTDDASKWNPAGVPNYDSYVSFDFPGAYTVTFPATMPQTSLQSFGGGTVTLEMSAPHTTGNIYVGSSGFPTCNFDKGVINTQYVEVGEYGYGGTMTVTTRMFGGPTEMHSAGAFHTSNFGDQVGNYGSGTLNVFGGAQYYCGEGNPASWGLNVGNAAGAVGTVNVQGRDATLFLKSKLHMVGVAALNVGLSGYGVLNVKFGGQADAQGDVRLARDPGSTGIVNIGPGNALGSSSLIARQALGIGKGVYAITTGHAEFNVFSSASVNVLGSCDVGSPNGDDGSVLRVLEGGRFLTTGGLRVWSTPGQGLDLRGGITHIRGGAFQWPSNRSLTISSQVGTPELWITNGVANTGPSTAGLTSQLFLGRAGLGTLRVTQPGTSFATGNGVTTLGDSTGGVGKIVADSSGTFSTGAYIIIGNHGTGEFDVLHGGHADCGATYISQSAPAEGAGLGTLLARGTGSTYLAHDLFVVGGGNGSSGGPGSATVDSGATITVLGGVAVNPPQTSIKGGAGVMTVSDGGLFTTTGTIENTGSVVLRNGEINAQGFYGYAAGTVGGVGRMVTSVQNSGLITPYSATDAFAAIRIVGNLQEINPAHYRTVLGSVGGRRCDTLVVTGWAVLGGTLDIQLDPSFVSTPGDTFTVLTCGLRSGTFANVTWNGAPLSGQATVVYAPGAVYVVIPGSSVGVGPGDGASLPRTIHFANAGVGSKLAFVLDLPAEADVQVKLYDITGREAATLCEGMLGAGQHRLEVQRGGHDMPSGAYFARASVRSQGKVTALRAQGILLR